VMLDIERHNMTGIANLLVFNTALMNSMLFTFFFAFEASALHKPTL
jgi:hypothetical protein